MMQPIEISRERRDVNHLELVLQLPASLFWFQGHFPRHPILPGITQVHWAIGYAREILGAPGEFGGIDSVKFQHPLRPEQRVRLSLFWDERLGRLSFSYVLLTERGEAALTISGGKVSLCP